jgi:hypothetical protein
LAASARATFAKCPRIATARAGAWYGRGFRAAWTRIHRSKRKT